jgi:hypothetical protein
VVEAWIDVRIDVLRVKFLDKGYPIWPLDLFRKQVFLFRQQKVALVAYQCSVREQKSKCAFPKPSTFAFPGRTFDCNATAMLFAAQMFLPEAWLEQEPWYRFNKDPACHPDKMHVHLLCDKNIPTKQELMVERAGRHEPTRNP